MRDLRLAGGGRIRIGPWKGQPTTAMLSPYLGPPIDRATIDSTVDQLVRSGYTHVHTAAIADGDVTTFEASGFTVKRRLHLLSRHLDTVPAATSLELRTARRWERDEIVELDASAFDDFWRFDITSLHDAAKATPTSRTRVTKERPFAGYALTGVARSVGYLQRLAVAPAASGQGIGSGLLIDALRWMRRRGATIAYVNTQVENKRALDLYLRHGFDHLNEGLSILERPLTGQ